MRLGFLVGRHRERHYESLSEEMKRFAVELGRDPNSPKVRAEIDVEERRRVRLENGLRKYLNDQTLQVKNFLFTHEGEDGGSGSVVLARDGKEKIFRFSENAGGITGVKPATIFTNNVLLSFFDRRA